MQALLQAGAERIPDSLTATIKCIDSGSITVEVDVPALVSMAEERTIRRAGNVFLEDRVVSLPPLPPVGFFDVLKVGDRAQVFRRIGWFTVQVVERSVDSIKVGELCGCCWPRASCLCPRVPCASYASLAYAFPRMPHPCHAASPSLALTPYNSSSPALLRA